MKTVMLATARRILNAASAAERANPFGSIGELVHATGMVEKWNREDDARALAAALVRVAGQRGLLDESADVFIWDAAALTHRLNPKGVQRLCARLV